MHHHGEQTTGQGGFARHSAMERLMLDVRDQIAGTIPADQLLGQSPAFMTVLQEALLAAREDTHALLVGEHGTGREVLARVVHAGGSRRREPFVALHCAPLPAASMHIELFGSAGGSGRPGQLDAAGAGTLYLHEVNQLDRSTQVRLLQVLKEGVFRRVRGTQRIPTQARIVASVGLPLDVLATSDRFRRDLFQVLQPTAIRVPPLRERREDIPALARYYLEQFRRSAPVLAEDFSQDAIERLVGYPWPGNIRELRNVVERTLVLHGQGPVIRAMHLPPEFAGQDTEVALDGSYSLSQAVNEFERRLVERALHQANGVQTRAAEILGTTRRVLKYRMEKLNISVP